MQRQTYINVDESVRCFGHATKKAYSKESVKINYNDKDWAAVTKITHTLITIIIMKLNSNEKDTALLLLPTQTKNKYSN